MLNTMLSRQKSYLDLLNKVPLFSEIPDYNLCKVIDIMREAKYQPNQSIYLQGSRGETLYIIKQGTVEFYKRRSNQDEPFLVRIMTQGSFFGEKSLLGEEYYHNDAISGPKGCILLQIEREAFSTFIGSISGLRNDYLGDDLKSQTQDTNSISGFHQLSHSSATNLSVNPHYHLEIKTDLIKRLTLDELHTVKTLDTDNFYRTELVVPKIDPRISYALKQMKKKNIVAMNLQDRVMEEKRLLTETSSNFIVKLFKTFRDRKYVYFLMEACLGGNLQRFLFQNPCCELDARFYVGCVIEALKHLHSLFIVYRDLKPTNILIDDRGYSKLANFIYSKKLQPGRKTFSFCGTPEYVAPEVGHDFAVDYWGLGILTYEIVVGRPPFVGDDPIKTYNVIMKGFESVSFPPEVSKNFESFVRKLCRVNPNERIGYSKKNFSDILKHKFLVDFIYVRWFEGFNWMNLRNMVMDAPVVPVLKDSTEGYDDDDEFPRDEEIPGDETIIPPFEYDKTIFLNATIYAAVLKSTPRLNSFVQSINS
ncbi:hypothetical protein HZS_5948 [Henneguya salminicola]|nr:hypothetical protein HZS_5948 [Henneguya salminicola]